MTWQKFLRSGNYTTVFKSFSLISIYLEIWNTGKWSDIIVMNNPVTLEGQLSSLCMACIIESINAIIPKQLTSFIFPPYYICNVIHLGRKRVYILIWWVINDTNNCIALLLLIALSISLKTVSQNSISLVFLWNTHDLVYTLPPLHQLY